MSLKDLALHYEHYETPLWAAEAILEKEILTRNVLDPCCGTGILAEAAMRAGYDVTAIDIHNWGYEPMLPEMDFLLADNIMSGDFTVFMNPPFSKATQFVEKCHEIGARKIVCFQRFAWWESKKRREFWAKYLPSKVYICGDRADCWRHDIPQEQRGSSTPTAHAWFVWERGQPGGTQLSHIYKG